MRWLVGVSLLIAAAAVAAPSVTTTLPAGVCPLCGTDGLEVPSRDQLAHCECEKWWRGKAPARLVFADCSLRRCAEHGPEADTPLVYVDMQLWRCPHDGLLFTRPEP